MTCKLDLTSSAIWASPAVSDPITAQSWVSVYEKQLNANDVNMLQVGIATPSETARNRPRASGSGSLPAEHSLEGQAELESRSVQIVVTTLTHPDQIGLLREHVDQGGSGRPAGSVALVAAAAVRHPTFQALALAGWR